MTGFLQVCVDNLSAMKKSGPGSMVFSLRFGLLLVVWIEVSVIVVPHISFED